ncbi:beta-lactamase-like protein [Naematelia encephala]|uniref:Beta-lactamase-like protein n=1 Tax=Naematelia encephala TaxID=71784 RepID=A0A1Y2BLC3_9TREE|nr:beta-lactamase-like protein [Naematelia encephala]
MKPLPPVVVHFLGTCSGGGPIVSRNCSSLAVDFGNDVWREYLLTSHPSLRLLETIAIVFDAADGTLPRLQQSSIKLSHISRIFVTHMHADHVLGIVSILTTIMSGIGETDEDRERLKEQGTEKRASVNLYGPVGLRQLIRITLQITSVTLSGAYAVHELIPRGGTASVRCEGEELHLNEAVGLDLYPDEQDVWQTVLQEGNGKNGRGWAVGAGPILHRVPAVGYVLQEPVPRLPIDVTAMRPLLDANASSLAELDPPIINPLSLLSRFRKLPTPPPYVLPSGDVLHPPAPTGQSPRKLVIFGDCSGGTSNQRFQEMCQDASLLVHECTNAAIPERIQRGEKGRRARMTGMDQGLVERSEKQTGSKVGAADAKVPQFNGNGRADDEESRKDRDDARRSEMRKKAQSRGHSTPIEVGEFARSIRARRVVVNHFSAMFPSPRYLSSEALPSILSGVAPFPYPTPFPPAHSDEPQIQPLPLTSRELHIRLVMQSLSDQINQVWNANIGPNEHYKMAVPARDLMVIRVPAHELTEAEAEEAASAKKEMDEVGNSWSELGGVWAQQAEEMRWIGVEPAPSAP